jgi:hypothetical protein
VVIVPTRVADVVVAPIAVSVAVVVVSPTVLLQLVVDLLQFRQQPGNFLTRHHLLFKKILLALRNPYHFAGSGFDFRLCYRSKIMLRNTVVINRKFLDAN